MKKVTLTISDEYFAFAEEQGAGDDFNGAEDYLNALLGGTLHRETQAHEKWKNAPPLFPIVVVLPPKKAAEAKSATKSKYDFLEIFEEDEGGGWRMKDDGDCDDDIPF